MSDTPIHAQKNIDNRTELTHLVEKLTTSGQPSLDVKVVKALKQICR
jgi:hypothetical protein